jgi:dipeptidyl aminopeptidase/acylaminoacyl peptidase
MLLREDSSMPQRSLRSILFALVAIALLSQIAAAKRPMTVDDLMKVERISAPQVSPDGKWVAYVQGTVNLEANKVRRHLWLVPVEGGTPKQLTRGEWSDTHPRWSPDSKALAFISTRSGSAQVWIIPVDGGEARQVTTISTEADGVTWARGSNMLVFTSNVFPACADDDCNAKRLEEREKSKVKAQIIDELLFRHWDQYRDGRYTHTFVVSADGGKPRDLTPGAVDSPTWFLGAPDAFAISPDGKEVVFTSNRSGGSSIAWTTNNDLFIVASLGGEPRNITKDNVGSDAAPQYSPNGRYIAYTSQARNGYESDLVRLRVYDRETGATQELSTGFDQWVGSFAWAPDSDTIYFNAPESGRQPLFKTSISKPKVEKVLDIMTEDLSVAADGKSVVFTSSSMIRPSEIFRAPATGGTPVPLTRANDALMAELEMNPAETVWTPGALGAKIHNLLIKPPGFDPSRKYPAIMLIHGGPQSSWDDAWSYRWNAQLFAARGYVVITPNYHGSTGFGQAFVEQISGDWGGASYEDVMKSADYLESLPYVDKTRIGAAGASAGGYMVNWIAGHTDRFKALVSHDGVYEARSMAMETEELWFDEWEHGGILWEKREAYEKSSPANFVQNIKTPMLIVHGELDYRVPVGQGIQLFQSLQRRGVPSRFLYFPDEGHWVLKPQNSQLWYRTVLAWLDKYLK